MLGLLMESLTSTSFPRGKKTHVGLAVGFAVVFIAALQLVRNRTARRRTAFPAILTAE